jgi:phosphinothricin acetyltransferase
MSAADGQAVLRIYQEGIDSGHATFAPAAPDWVAWDRTHLPHSRIVAVEGSGVVGWAALAGVSSREVYRGVAEVSVYVARAARGRGLGGRLMAAVIEASEGAGIWTLQAGIFAENPASIALHEKYGFRILGTRERVGKMGHGPLAGRWRDVVLMERRSRVTGTE